MKYPQYRFIFYLHSSESHRLCDRLEQIFFSTRLMIELPYPLSENDMSREHIVAFAISFMMYRYVV